MDDWEPKLRNLKPTIRWQSSCSDKFCESTNLSSQRGYVKVPSNYATNGKTFDVGFQRVTVAGSKPSIHMIHLAGGPGGYGSDEVDSATMWAEVSKGDVAGYAVDHRGLGSSGEFVSAKYNWSDIKSDFHKNLTSGPFDVKDLTLDTAALDIGMIALAIKMGPEWTERSRIVLSGFSYGSEWAHHSALRLPKLYNSVIMGGIPPGPNTQDGTLRGIVENCAMDAFCRSKMGGAAEKNYRRAVRNMVDPNYNECTELFHSKFRVSGSSQGERVRSLSMMFMDLIMGNHEKFRNSRQYRSVMAVIPIIKATSDCTNLDEYRQKVIEPLDEYIEPWNKKDSLGIGDDTNSLVNSVVFLSYKYCFTSNTEPSVSSKHDDVHSSVAYKKIYHWKYQDLKENQTNLTCTARSPVVSDSTEFVFAQSRMDLNTTYYPGWERYNQIKVPRKQWLLYENRGHDGYEGVCMANMVLRMLYPDQSTFDYEACMKKENEERKLDWTLKGAPDFQNVWDVVADEPAASPVFMPVPTYHSEGVLPSPKATAYEAPPKPMTNRPGGLSKDQVIYLGLLGLLPAVAILGCIIYIYCRKSNSDDRSRVGEDEGGIQSVLDLSNSIHR